MSEQETDHEGRPIPPDETDDTIIKVWEIDPHPLMPGEVLWERSYQKIIAYVRSNLEHLCELDDVFEPDGLTITIRVIWMTRRDYLEATSDE